MLIILGIIGLSTLSIYGIYLMYHESYCTRANRSTRSKGIEFTNYDKDLVSDSEESEDSSESEYESDSDDDDDSDEDDSESEEDCDHYSESSVGVAGERKSLRESRMTVTTADLASWGIVNRIDDICSKISEQLKTECIEHLKTEYLAHPAYKRNPIRTFRKMLRKRGHMKHLSIPDDLPLVALHKLHETPAYLSMIYGDHTHLHQQLMIELKRRVAITN